MKIVPSPGVKCPVRTEAISPAGPVDERRHEHEPPGWA